MYFKFLIFSLVVLILSSCEEKVDQAWVSVNLPGPPPEKENKEENAIDIFVYENHYEYQKKKHSLEEMEVIFTKLSEDITLNIKVSQKAAHDKLVLLLDRMNKVELSKFNLHTLKK